MASSKSSENHNWEKPKKMKETAKRHKEDQGSPSEKKNIKCQEKWHEKVFRDHPTA